MRRAAALLLTLLAATPLAAQTQADPAGTSAVQLLPRYAFHLNAEHLSGESARLVWDTNFGGELDVVDYGAGRATFVANYQAVLGEEFRSFDPNQGNYILAGLASARVRGFEVAAQFYHQSRHLSDRPKRFAIDWNMLGGRVSRSLVAGRNSVEARVDIRRTILKSYVDYDWEVEGDLHGRTPLRSWLAATWGGTVRVLGVDGSRGRGTQGAYRAEAGIRVQGTAAAVELFVAGERRVDPYPLEFDTVRWVSVGMRLLSR